MSESHYYCAADGHCIAQDKLGIEKARIEKLEKENDKLKQLCRYQFMTLGMYSTPYNYKTPIPYPDGSMKTHILRDEGADAREAIETGYKLGFDGDTIRSWPGPKF